MKNLTYLAALLRLASSECTDQDVLLWSGEDRGPAFTDKVVSMSTSGGTLIALAKVKLGNTEGALADLRSIFQSSFGNELSAPCSSCFEKNVVCGFNHCKSPCVAGAATLACQECTNKFCYPDFIDCAGISDPARLPPPPVKKQKKKPESPPTAVLVVVEESSVVIQGTPSSEDEFDYIDLGLGLTEPLVSSRKDPPPPASSPKCGHDSETCCGGLLRC